MHMHSSLIGKIDKAKRYALEKDRVAISSLTARFRGDHDSYTLALEEGAWRCTCPFFSSWGVCSHTMAMEKILADMLLRPSSAAI